MPDHIAVVMMGPQRLLEKMRDSFYDLDIIFHRPPGRIPSGFSGTAAMAVLPLTAATSLNEFVECARQQAREAKGTFGYRTIEEQTRAHVAHFQQRPRDEPRWGIGMNPNMQGIYLDAFIHQLYNHRRLDDVDQALLSIIEFPTPPKYPNLDVEGLITHGSMRQAEADNRSYIMAARREIFREAGIYVPNEVFDERLVPPGLPFQHGPFNLRHPFRNSTIVFLTVRIPCSSTFSLTQTTPQMEQELFADSGLDSRRFIGKKCIMLKTKKCIMLKTTGASVASGRPVDKAVNEISLAESLASMRITNNEVQDIPEVGCCSIGYEQYMDPNQHAEYLQTVDGYARRAIEGKKKLFFGGLGDYLAQQVWMDDEASYSVTEMQLAEECTQFILKEAGLSDPADAIITDCTACIGGNTINFAKHFKHVNAIEIDERRCGFLRHNIELLYEAKQSFVTLYNSDTVQMVKSLKQDVLYFHPPCDSDCERADTMDLFMSGTELSQVCASLNKVAKYLVLQVPLNFNEGGKEGFTDRCNEGGKEGFTDRCNEGGKEGFTDRCIDSWKFVSEKVIGTGKAGRPKFMLLMYKGL